MALIPDPLDEILKRCWDELLNDMGDFWWFFGCEKPEVLRKISILMIFSMVFVKDLNFCKGMRIEFCSLLSGSQG